MAFDQMKMLNKLRKAQSDLKKKLSKLKLVMALWSYKLPESSK